MLIVNESVLIKQTRSRLWSVQEKATLCYEWQNEIAMSYGLVFDHYKVV